ncbi:DNA-3-methyladenine glycosylase I [Vaginella massiliensis]|uniref:DNA-3-methyladenine glycosylase I n=1 Tax=Vaginella massiliensis TaxID=1816680 RepID=UPI0037531281
MSYCKVIEAMPNGQRKDLHQQYHDFSYGFPIEDDEELFGRLILEINQAGLSWETILKKEKSFRQAYANFDIAKVANFDEQDRERLLQNAGIIRNRLKINAAIENAKTILQIQEIHGSFKNWLDAHHPKTKEEWTQLFKKNFKFMGGEIVNEFLMSIGYLPGAHDETCRIHQQIVELNPKWCSV